MRSVRSELRGERREARRVACGPFYKCLLEPRLRVLSGRMAFRRACFVRPISTLLTLYVKDCKSFCGSIRIFALPEDAPEASLRSGLAPGCDDLPNDRCKDRHVNREGEPRGDFPVRGVGPDFITQDRGQAVEPEGFAEADREEGEGPEQIPGVGRAAEQE